MNEIAFNNIFSGNIRQVFLTCREIRISGYHLLRYKTATCNRAGRNRLLFSDR
jgi:hypothetical protein